METSSSFNATNFPKKITLFDMNFPTDTVNVLPHMQELRQKWREQDFRFTKEQQEEYDILLAARRERVKYFYDNDLVSKGGLRKREEEPED